ncbi:MAG: potassium channel family protein [Nocardioidaceae bacterium]
MDNDMQAATAYVFSVLVLGIVAYDVFQTVLAPSASGLSSRWWYLFGWRAARVMPVGLREAALRVAGPLSIVATIGTWIVGMWLAFALLYLPSADALVYSPEVPFATRGLSEALYLSAAALTTIGFGDVVAPTTSLRLLTTVEAACGLGLITFTLGYLAAVYTVTSELRTSAQSVHDLGADDPDVAAELVLLGGVSVLTSVHRDLVSVRQHMLRFPVLHAFHPPADESLVALLRGATGLWLAARWGLCGGPGHMARPAIALEQALSRLLDDTDRHLETFGGAVRSIQPNAERARRLEGIRDSIRALNPERVGREPLDDEAAALLARSDALISRYAALHDYPDP